MQFRTPAHMLIIRKSSLAVDATRDCVVGSPIRSNTSRLDAEGRHGHHLLKPSSASRAVH